MTEAVIIQKPVYSANQWTGYYMITASVMKGLKANPSFFAYQIISYTSPLDQDSFFN